MNGLFMCKISNSLWPHILPNRTSRSGQTSVTFGSGPFAVSKGINDPHQSVPVSTEGVRRGLASHTPFRLRITGDSRIASRSVHCLLTRSHAPSPRTETALCVGGLVRLVLPCCDWYTSCSSSNLPSSEYAGQDRRSESPLVIWSLDANYSIH
jgi:hypothetical protein